MPVNDIDTDYLVIGAGASGLAFVDALLAGDPSAEVVMVDRQHAPGGHWLGAYPFVRLHQPSANYGVASRSLGADRIDESGPNAGFYERASAPEVCGYFAAVMDDMVGSGRVRFLPMTDYRGEQDGGHAVVSRLTEQVTTIRPRRRLVDATYVESSIPSRHTPSFVVEEGARLVPPNDLVELGDAPSGYTVLGAGKTAMDTCTWLLSQGVDPGAIRWVRPRDVWMFDRALVQPGELVGSFMQMQAGWVKSAAEAADPTDFMRRLEGEGVFIRIDPDTEPEAFLGAIVSRGELEQLRQIENVVRLGRVHRISGTGAELDNGPLACDPRHVFVDCTARGVPGAKTALRPMFEPGRLTLQMSTIGMACLSMATVGTVEALRDDDAEKNRLCPPVAFTPNATDAVRTAHAGMSGLLARGAEPDLAAWDANCRLNPARGAADHLDDPRVGAAFGVMAEHIGPAMRNLSRMVQAPA